MPYQKKLTPPRERAPAGVERNKSISLRLMPEERAAIVKMAGNRRTLNAVARELVLAGLRASYQSQS